MGRNVNGPNNNGSRGYYHNNHQHLNNQYGMMVNQQGQRGRSGNNHFFGQPPMMVMPPQVMMQQAQQQLNQTQFGSRNNVGNISSSPTHGHNIIKHSASNEMMYRPQFNNGPQMGVPGMVGAQPSNGTHHPGGYNMNMMSQQFDKLDVNSSSPSNSMNGGLSGGATGFMDTQAYQGTQMMGSQSNFYGGNVQAPLPQGNEYMFETR